MPLAPPSSVFAPPSGSPAAPRRIHGAMPGSWKNVAAKMAAEVDALLANRDPEQSRAIFSNVSYPWDSTVFVPNAEFFAPGLREQLTGISMRNGAWHQSYGPTMITPRHGILCGHNGPDPVTALRFVKADGSEVFDTSILKRINDYGSNYSDDAKQTMVGDLSIVLTAAAVPDWVYQAPIMPISSSVEAQLSPYNPPTLAVSQGNATAEAFPSNSGAWTPNGRMLYVSAISPYLTFNSLREPFARRPKVTGDSGTPDFILFDGVLHLHRIINYGSGTGEICFQRLAYINSLIARADASAGISTGYTATVSPLPVL